MWHDSLDICPHVAAFFQSGPGLAFLHRIVIAFHVVCVEVGACGIRLVCLFLNLTGLNRGSVLEVEMTAQPEHLTYVTTRLCGLHAATYLHSEHITIRRYFPEH